MERILTEKEDKGIQDFFKQRVVAIKELEGLEEEEKEEEALRKERARKRGGKGEKKRRREEMLIEKQRRDALKKADKKLRDMLGGENPLFREYLKREAKRCGYMLGVEFIFRSAPVKAEGAWDIYIYEEQWGRFTREQKFRPWWWCFELRVNFDPENLNWCEPSLRLVRLGGPSNSCQHLVVWNGEKFYPLKTIPDIAWSQIEKDLRIFDNHQLLADFFTKNFAEKRKWRDENRIWGGII